MYEDQGNRALPCVRTVARDFLAHLDSGLPPDAQPLHTHQDRHRRRDHGLLGGRGHGRRATGARRSHRRIPHRRRPDRHRSGAGPAQAGRLSRMEELLDRAGLLGHHRQERGQARLRAPGGKRSAHRRLSLHRRDARPPPPCGRAPGHEGAGVQDRQAAREEHHPLRRHPAHRGGAQGHR